MSRGRLIAVAVTLPLLILAGVAGGRLLSPVLSNGRPDPADVLARLRFLDQTLTSGAAADMQALFPEGYFFTWVLRGLAWAEFGHQLAGPSGSEPRSEAFGKALESLAHLDDPPARQPFAEVRSPDGGMFFRGWRAWLAALAYRIAPPARRAELEARLAAETAAVAGALAGAAGPFFESYPGAAWPVDNLVAVSALAVADCLTGVSRHDERIRAWTAAAARHLDPVTGLWPHAVAPLDQRPVAGPRATSSVLGLRFLAELDSALAAAQYGSFKRHFFVEHLGLLGVLEYPAGESHPGDVDSGPLIMGVSLSSSAVAVGAALRLGEPATADRLLRQAEVFGLPVTLSGRKSYAFGQLPVGDAFVVWSMLAAPACPPR